MLIELIALVTRELEKLAGRLLANSNSLPVRIAAEMIGVSLKAPMDERLAKIEVARSSLREALGAMDDLQTEAEANRAALKNLNAKIADAEGRKDVAHIELETIRKLYELDAGAVRKSLGLPSPLGIWAGRVVSFIFGVFGSILASWIWYLTPWG